jgi:hypothetical protein
MEFAVPILTMQLLLAIGALSLWLIYVELARICKLLQTRENAQEATGPPKRVRTQFGRASDGPLSFSVVSA